MENNMLLRCLITLQIWSNSLSIGVTIPGLKQDKLCEHNLADSYETIQPEEYDTPYTVNINQTKYLLNKPITVTISGTAPFRGFIVQARRYNQVTVHGYFRSAHVTPTSCRATNDTVVTWLTEPRTSLVLEWVAPAQDVGTLHFVATIFKDSTKFWTNVTSHSFRKGFDPIDTSKCGIIKGCYRFSESSPGWPCDANNCTYLVTFHERGQYADFELSTSSQWAAIGFSSDKDMGGDDVIMCQRSASAGAEVSHYYTELTSQSASRRSVHDYSNTEVDLTDGRLSCRVTRPLKIYDDLSSVDLSNDWYQLYAWGPMRHGNSPLLPAMDSPPTSEYKTTLRSSYNVISRASARTYTSAIFSITSVISFIWVL